MNTLFLHSSILALVSIAIATSASATATGEAASSEGGVVLDGGHYHYYPPSEADALTVHSDPTESDTSGNASFGFHTNDVNIPSVLYTEHPDDWDPQADAGRGDDGGMGIGLPIPVPDEETPPEDTPQEEDEEQTTETQIADTTSRTGVRGFSILRGHKTGGNDRRKRRQ
uniref:Uncharacterized protein n=1 Tax=Cyclophora tenuis TaxID=216820 RepID=A0A7S1GHT6_CYCTE|mmetsp:Transcript_15819/g.26785  ORF Transcript_15819/g.26785 Transcript_15819/m.26785 type:complete len:170 (+) Transcript_15819:801-1310(+)